MAAQARQARVGSCPRARSRVDAAVHAGPAPRAAWWERAASSPAQAGHSPAWERSQPPRPRSPRRRLARSHRSPPGSARPSASPRWGDQRAKASASPRSGDRHVEAEASASLRSGGGYAWKPPSRRDLPRKTVCELTRLSAAELQIFRHRPSVGLLRSQGQIWAEISGRASVPERTTVATAHVR
jgi:hypothetical protein